MYQTNSNITPKRCQETRHNYVKNISHKIGKTGNIYVTLQSIICTIKCYK